MESSTKEIVAPSGSHSVYGRTNCIDCGAATAAGRRVPKRPRSEPADAVNPEPATAKRPSATCTLRASASNLAGPMEIKLHTSKCLGEKAKRHYAESNYKVINVTSKSDDDFWKQLSPFYPHGGIPVPENPGRFAMSVEGLWQGLKVFENESVDLSKLNNKKGKNLKRGGKKRGKVRHHWWGPLPWENEEGLQPVEELDYVEARRRIYLPAYTWVLENKVLDIVKQLAREASQSKILLVDYFTNTDIGNVKTPLSHAGLLKQYIENHFQELVRS